MRDLGLTLSPEGWSLGKAGGSQRRRWESLDGERYLFTPHAPHPVILGGSSQSVLVSVCAWRGQRRNNLNTELCLQGPRAWRNKIFGFSLHTLKLLLFVMCSSPGFDICRRLCICYPRTVQDSLITLKIGWSIPFVINLAPSANPGNHWCWIEFLNVNWILKSKNVGEDIVSRWNTKTKGFKTVFKNQ